MKKLIALTLVVALLAVAPGYVIAQDDHCAARHLVKTGENLFRIGRRYGVPWPSIAQANQLANPNLIFVGQILCIPAAVTGTPTPTSATATATPTATATTTVTPTVIATPVLPGGVIPTFIIAAVVRDQTVTILTANFPARQTFTVRMGAMGTRGINGLVVGTTDSGAGGSFQATYPIPAALHGARQIALRMDSPSGYFSYNWFYNNTTR